jgi:hypothetical protein
MNAVLGYMLELGAGTYLPSIRPVTPDTGPADDKM